MSQKAIRFAVTNGADKRAATWRLWSQRSSYGEEIYLTCRELRGAIHTSFHATGQWHTTYSQEALESLKTGGTEDAQKHIEAWPKPSEVKPGITLAYKILTPWSAPTTDLTDAPPSLVQLPNAPTGHANETMVLIVRAGMNLELVNATRVGEFALSSGERVVVANHRIVMPEVKIPNSGRGGFFGGKSKENLNSDNLRALVFLSDHNGHRMILDAPVARLGA